MNRCIRMYLVLHIIINFKVPSTYVFHTCQFSTPICNSIYLEKQLIIKMMSMANSDASYLYSTLNLLLCIVSNIKYKISIYDYISMLFWPQLIILNK